MNRNMSLLLIALLAILAIASTMNSGPSPYNELLDRHKRSICETDPSVDCPPGMDQPGSQNEGQPSQNYGL